VGLIKMSMPPNDRRAAWAFGAVVAIGLACIVVVAVAASAVGNWALLVLIGSIVTLLAWFGLVDAKIELAPPQDKPTVSASDSIQPFPVESFLCRAAVVVLVVARRQYRRHGEEASMRKGESGWG
jgi:hypothetical protein